jgi:hypothetical protein
MTRARAAGPEPNWERLVLLGLERFEMSFQGCAILMLSFELCLEPLDEKLEPENFIA